MVASHLDKNCTGRFCCRLSNSGWVLPSGTTTNVSYSHTPGVWFSLPLCPMADWCVNVLGAAYTHCGRQSGQRGHWLQILDICALTTECCPGRWSGSYCHRSHLSSWRALASVAQVITREINIWDSISYYSLFPLWEYLRVGYWKINIDMRKCVSFHEYPGIGMSSETTWKHLNVES